MRLSVVSDVVKLYPGLADTNGSKRWLVFHIELHKKYRLGWATLTDMRFMAECIIGAGM